MLKKIFASFLFLSAILGSFRAFAEDKVQIVANGTTGANGVIVTNQKIEVSTVSALVLIASGSIKFGDGTTQTTAGSGGGGGSIVLQNTNGAFSSAISTLSAGPQSGIGFSFSGAASSITLISGATPYMPAPVSTGAYLNQSGMSLSSASFYGINTSSLSVNFLAQIASANVSGTITTTNTVAAPSITFPNTNVVLTSSTYLQTNSTGSVLNQPGISLSTITVSSVTATYMTINNGGSFNIGASTGEGQFILTSTNSDWGSISVYGNGASTAAQSMSFQTGTSSMNFSVNGATTARLTISTGVTVNGQLYVTSTTISIGNNTWVWESTLPVAGFLYWDGARFYTGSTSGGGGGVTTGSSNTWTGYQNIQSTGNGAANPNFSVSTGTDGGSYQIYVGTYSPNSARFIVFGGSVPGQDSSGLATVSYFDDSTTNGEVSYFLGNRSLNGNNQNAKTALIFGQGSGSGSAVSRIRILGNGGNTEVTQLEAIQNGSIALLPTGSGQGAGINTANPSSMLDVSAGSLTIRGTNKGLAVGTTDFLVFNGDVTIGTPTARGVFAIGMPNGPTADILIVSTGSTDLFEVNGASIEANVPFFEATTQITVPDYVFDPDYSLMPISALADYVRANRHLPNVKSAEEQEKSPYSNMEMKEKLLEKIEEQALYIAQLNDNLEKLEARVLALEKK